MWIHHLTMRHSDWEPTKHIWLCSWTKPWRPCKGYRASSTISSSTCSHLHQLLISGKGRFSSLEPHFPPHVHGEMMWWSEAAGLMDKRYKCLRTTFYSQLLKIMTYVSHLNTFPGEEHKVCYNLNVSHTKSKCRKLSRQIHMSMVLGSRAFA